METPHNQLPSPIYQPRPEGFSAGGEQAPSGWTLFQSLPLGAAKSLQEIEDQFMFFTLAIPYLKLGMGDGPLTDFRELVRQPVEFFHHRFNTQIFSGLNAGNDTAWNHVLMAIRIRFAVEFVDFMNSIMFTSQQTENGKTRTNLFKIGVQELLVSDPLIYDVALFLPEPFPEITVVAFGVDSNLGRLYLEAGNQAVPASLKLGPPTERMLRLAGDLGEGVNFHAKDDASNENRDQIQS